MHVFTPSRGNHLLGFGNRVSSHFMDTNHRRMASAKCSVPHACLCHKQKMVRKCNTISEEQHSYRPHPPSQVFPSKSLLHCPSQPNPFLESSWHFTDSRISTSIRLLLSRFKTRLRSTLRPSLDVVNRCSRFTFRTRIARWWCGRGPPSAQTGCRWGRRASR